MAFSGADGPLLLGRDVTVVKTSDFDMGHRSTDGLVHTDAAATLERDGFDFTFASAWTGALTFDTAEVIGDRTFRFNRTPGSRRVSALREFRSQDSGMRTVEYLPCQIADGDRTVAIAGMPTACRKGSPGGAHAAAVMRVSTKAFS